MSKIYSYFSYEKYNLAKNGRWHRNAPIDAF